MNISDLKGKTALVTGASSGIGKAISKALVDCGTNIIMIARDKDKLQKTAKELGKPTILSVNISNKKDVKQTFSKLEQKIDICFNNAGIFKSTPLLGEESDNFEKTIETNVYGVWYITREVAKIMKQNNTPGSIINIGSIRANNFIKSEIAGYCLSKSAVQQMTRVLALELSPFNIRVNCIDPGVFQTPITKENIEKSGDYIKSLIPANFIAKPEEITDLALYLASNKASKYVTGSCITIDGGASCLGSEH